MRPARIFFLFNCQTPENLTKKYRLYWACKNFSFIQLSNYREISKLAFKGTKLLTIQMVCDRLTLSFIIEKSNDEESKYRKALQRMFPVADIKAQG